MRLTQTANFLIVKKSEEYSDLFIEPYGKEVNPEVSDYMEIENELIPILEILEEKYPRYVEVRTLPFDDDWEKVCFITDLWLNNILDTEADEGFR